MAIDLNLTDMTSGYNLGKMNNNFQEIETKLERALSRYNDSPNQMETDLDMNGKNIINVGSIGLEGEYPLEEIVNHAKEWANKDEDSLISIDAGGDGVNDYSSLHWAKKAEATYALVTEATGSEAIEALLRTPELYGGTDGVAIQAAIDATPVNGKLIFRPGVTYNIEGTITLNKPITIIAYGATLSWASNVDNQGIRITSSGVNWYGGKIKGPQGTDKTKNTQYGLYAYGTSDDYIKDIRIFDAEITDWGYFGIWKKFVSRFWVEGCHIYNIGYAGIANSSVVSGVIRSNIIHDILPNGVIGSQENAYGVYISSGTDEQRSFDVLVEGNIVYNVKTWEALDTHGGKAIRFTNNRISNCQRGIVVTYVPGTYSPEECEISGNVITYDYNILGRTHPGVRAGIMVSGEDFPAVVEDRRAHSITVRANIIRGYGDYNVSPGNEGAIYIKWAKRVICTNNNIYDSGTCAITALSVLNLTCSDNTIDSLGDGSSTLSAYPTGTITFTTNPTDGQYLIFFNTCFYSFKTTPSASYHIQIGANLAATLANAAATLNAETDGRVSGVSFTAGANTLTITSKYRGYLYEGSTKWSYNASGVTGATPTTNTGLSGGNQSGPCGIFITRTTYDVSSEGTTGIISNNTFNTQHTCVVVADENTKLDIGVNRNTSTGILYDCSKSTGYPNNNVASIQRIGGGRIRTTLPTISAGSVRTAYLSVPGCNVGVTLAGPGGGYAVGSLHADDGNIVMELIPASNLLEIKYRNPTSGSVTPGEVRAVVEVHMQKGNNTVILPND